jgi:hypothetical protein
LIFGGVIAAVILFFTLLPTVISSKWGKQQVLGLAAQYIPGELSVDSWSLKWIGGQKITGIGYTDANIRLHTEEATIAKGIFSLLMNPDDIGTVKVIRPDVQVILPDPEQKQPSLRPGKAYPGQTKADKAESPQPEAKTRPDDEPVTLPAIRGKLVAEEGAISLLQPGEEAEPVAKGIKLEVDLASLSDNITYSLAVASPDGKGNLSSAGKVAIKPGNPIPQSLHPTGDLLINNWDVNRLLKHAARLGSAPTGTGLLDAKVTYGGSFAEGIIIDGTINLSELKLSGGPLGNDQPYLDTTSLVFSASAGLDMVKLTSLTLSSPVANGQLAAVVDPGGNLQLNSDLRIDLHEVAQQIPRTLNLQEGLNYRRNIGA